MMPQSTSTPSAPAAVFPIWVTSLRLRLLPSPHHASDLEHPHRLLLPSHEVSHVPHTHLALIQQHLSLCLPTSPVPPHRSPYIPCHHQRHRHPMCLPTRSHRQVLHLLKLRQAIIMLQSGMDYRESQVVRAQMLVGQQEWRGRTCSVGDVEAAVVATVAHLRRMWPTPHMIISPYHHHPLLLSYFQTRQSPPPRQTCSKPHHHRQLHARRGIDSQPGAFTCER